MRRLSLLVALFACGACIINPPVVLPVDTAAWLDQTYDCALRSLNERQYTITGADRASGFLRARRLQRHVIGTNSEYDQQTVSVYRADDGHTMLRVVPSSSGDKDDTLPTGDGLKDQSSLVAKCATKQSG